MIYTLIRKDGEGNVDAVISFDSVTASSEAHTATVTTQTVENGFNITDNISIEPATYDIEAIISSYSLFNIDKEIVWNGEAFEVEDSTNTKAHTVARDEIIRIFEERSILTLVESTANSGDSDYAKRYEELQSEHFKETNNCVMTSLSISHPSDGTGAFYVSFKLQKIHVAVVSTVQLTESEMSPALRGLVVKDKNEASSTSTSTSAEGVAVQDGDMTDSLAQAEKDALSRSDDYANGRTQADFAKFRANALKKPLAYQVAVKLALEYGAADGRGYDVVRFSTGYTVVAR